MRALQAELELADGNLDAIDRKAALVPVVLAAVAGLFLVPDAAIGSGTRFWLLAAATITGVVSAGLALRVLEGRELVIGPDAPKVADNVHLDTADFDKALAKSLARSIDHLTFTAIWKVELLNRSMRLAVGTTVLLAIQRVIGDQV